MGGVWHKELRLRAALRRALAVLGVVATLTTMVPSAVVAGAAAPGATSGSTQASHYFDAALPDQFDAYVWFRQTRVVTPLSAAARTGMPNTYLFGL